MKKLFLFAVLALFAFNTYAQEDDNSNGSGYLSKGNWAISGAIGYESESTGDIKDNSFSFMPAAGVMVTDNIAVGAKFGIMSGTMEDTSGETKENTFMAGVFGQYYFAPKNQFSWLATLGAGYTSYKDEFTPSGGGTTSEFKGNGFYIAAAPGINYWVSDNFGLQAHVGELSYHTTKPDEDNAESTDNFEFGVNFKKVRFGAVLKF